MYKCELHGLKIGDILTNKVMLPTYGEGLQETGYDYKVVAILDNGVSVRPIYPNKQFGPIYDLTEDNIEKCLDLRIKND